jgi:hypothetical protein
VLENQLFLIIGFEHQGVFVEAFDAACEFYPAQKVNRDNAFFFARIVQKAVLYVLRWFIHRRILPKKLRPKSLSAV